MFFRVKSKEKMKVITYPKQAASGKRLQFAIENGPVEIVDLLSH